MCWEIQYLDVNHGGQATESLRTNAQCIHRFEYFQTQLLGAIGWAALAQLVNING